MSKIPEWNEDNIETLAAYVTDSMSRKDLEDYVYDDLVDIFNKDKDAYESNAEEYGWYSNE